MASIINGHELPLYAMNAGDGPHSYVQNSSYQRALDVAKLIIEEEIAKKFDIKHLDSTRRNSGFCIADFGCSTGHNSFPAMEIIVEAIKQNHESSGDLIETPEYYVFFNDVATNDFNTLFTSLPPHRNYHAVGVPGDFHGRLLPESSLHFAYSSWSVQWLTEAPKAVGGGLMALLLPGVPAFWNPETEYTIPSDINLLGSCLMDMAKKGRISEAKIDSFNLPYYFTTPQQLKAILDRSHGFTIERMEILNNPRKYSLPSIDARAAFYRAVHERLVTNHFGSEIIDELFDLYTKKLAASPVFLDPNNDKSIMILVVLKRKTD